MEGLLSYESSSIEDTIEPCFLCSKDDWMLVDDLLPDPASFSSCLNDETQVDVSHEHVSSFDSDLQDLFGLGNVVESTCSSGLTTGSFELKSHLPISDVLIDELLKELGSVLNSHVLPSNDGEESSDTSIISPSTSEDLHSGESSEFESQDQFALGFGVSESHGIASTECSPPFTDILSFLESVNGLEPDSDSGYEGLTKKCKCSTDFMDFDKKTRLYQECTKKAVRREKNNASSRVSRAKRKSRRQQLCSRELELETANAKLRLQIERMSKEADFMRTALVAKLSSLN